jgi:hypothetical protein
MTMSKATLAVAATLLLTVPVAAAALENDNAGAPSRVPTRTYAERLYADYAADSEKDVQIQVTAAAAGALPDLAGRTLESIVGLPAHHLEANDGPLTLTGTRFEPLDLDRVNASELGSVVDGFDAAGLPLAEGSYRLLEVAVSIDGERREHRAAEFCWHGLGRCVVFDPTIEFLDSIVSGHRQRKADGWAVKVETGRLDDAGTETKAADGKSPNATTAVCGLASATWTNYKQLTWPPYTITYYGVFGQRMIEKRFGEQQAGMRCDASCWPAPYGHSYASSAATFNGAAYSVDCGNLAVHGTSGRSIKFQAESRCAHRLTFGARADASFRGAGLGVYIQWDQQGGIDSRGGQVIETCGFF